MEVLVLMLGVIAAGSIAMNILLVNKVNDLRRQRKADRRSMKTFVTATVKAACERQDIAAHTEELNRILESQIEIAREVVEKLTNKIDDMKKELLSEHHANNCMYNTLYDWLQQGKVVKKVWNKSLIEFYDINTMSIGEVHDLFGRSMSA